VLDTLVYLAEETDVWFELTTLLIPGHNDSDEEIDRMTRWVVERLGPEVPMHFTAFHPDFKLPRGPADAARDVVPRPEDRPRQWRPLRLHGNVHDPAAAALLPRLRGAADRP